MKRAIVYAACIFIVSTAAAAPGSKLVQRFNETFPNAKNVKWIDDKAGFFVSFSQNGNYNKVFYNKGGNFVYSLKYFSGDALPVNIIMTLNEKYDAAKIIGATELTTQNNTVYSVKLSKEDKLYCLDLLADGTIVKEENYINGSVK